MRTLVTTMVLVLTLSALSSPLQALSLERANACIAELLGAYTKQRYPAHLINEAALVQRAIGAAGRTMSKTEKTYAEAAARAIIRESFVNPSGQYRYSQVSAASVDTSHQYQFRVEGTLHLSSPKYTGRATFTALSNSKCQVEQVRIEQIYALDLMIRDELRDDPKLRRHFP